MRRNEVQPSPVWLIVRERIDGKCECRTFRDDACVWLGVYESAVSAVILLTRGRP